MLCSIGRLTLFQHLSGHFPLIMCTLLSVVGGWQLGDFFILPPIPLRPNVFNFWDILFLHPPLRDATPLKTKEKKIKNATQWKQNSYSPGAKCSTLTYLFSGNKMQPGTVMCFLKFYTLVFLDPPNTHTDFL